MDRLLRWPSDRLFPALDLARLLVLNPAAAGHLAASVPLLDVPISCVLDPPMRPSYMGAIADRPLQLPS